MKIFISFVLISSLFLLYGGGMSSSELRSLAKQNDLKSTPKSYNQLLKLFDNPKNHITAKKINLGRTLFFEPLLSRDESMTCASCHKMGEGEDDNLPTAIGFKNRKNQNT